MKKIYTVKRIENRSPECSYKTYTTWDVYKTDPKGFYHRLVAECDRRSDAVLISKALNAIMEAKIFLRLFKNSNLAKHSGRRK